MISGEKLVEALKELTNSLLQKENNNNDDDIEKIEEENNQLRTKKMELMVNLERPSEVGNSLVLVKDMLARQKNLNQCQLEFKQNSIVRFKDRSGEVKMENSSLKQKLLKDIENLMTLPYHDVLDKVIELEEIIAENLSVIEELAKQHSELIKNEQNEEDCMEDIRFIETLKSIADLQSKLIEKLKENIPNHMN
ncbi:uncharacterized protein LOC129907359 isoform X1 [Episyrphus balteatus]|uniref:uncharacterized protein LOC129907359 isoform X1 n=1 Tax=Episyrphus balteatus TaxID=286459 RepID=UPI002484FF24|nr:uncharacterized protein LOC129907359 isoform X1 [Episyrphus balteatus]